MCPSGLFVASYRSLALLDGLVPPMIQYKDQTMTKIEAATKPVKPPKFGEDGGQGNGGGDKPIKPTPKKVIKQLNRMVLFPQKTLEDTDDIDAYLAQIN